MESQNTINYDAKSNWSLETNISENNFEEKEFNENEFNRIFENIKKCQVEFPDDIKVNEKIISLMKKIFVVTPVQRPSLSEILEDISRIDA